MRNKRWVRDFSRGGRAHPPNPFSSFCLILASGVAGIAGGIAAGLPFTASSAHGSAVGLALGILALALGFLPPRVFYRLGSWSPPRPRGLAIVPILPALALLAQPVAIQIIRSGHGTRK